MDRKWKSRHSLDFFCLTVPKIFVEGLPDFQKVSGIWNFEGLEGVIIFLPSKIFCLTVPEKFVKEQLCVSETFWYRKFSCRRGASRFCVANFLSHSTEKFRRGILVFRKNSGLKKMHKMVYHDFVGNWFSHSTEKVRRGTLHFSENLLYRKRFRIGGDITTFSRNILSHSTEKIPSVTPLIEKVSALKKICIR